MTQLAFIGTSSGEHGCPTIFITERGTLVVQGASVTDRHALEQISQHGNGIPPHESCVEIPVALLPFIDVEALKRVSFGDTHRPAFEVDAAAVGRVREQFLASAKEPV